MLMRIAAERCTRLSDNLLCVLSTIKIEMQEGLKGLKKGKDSEESKLGL